MATRTARETTPTSVVPAATPERASRLRGVPAVLHVLRFFALALVAIIGFGVALPTSVGVRGGSERVERGRLVSPSSCATGGSSVQWRDRPARPAGYLDTTEADGDTDDLEREERFAPHLASHDTLGFRTVPLPRDDDRAARAAIQRDPSHFAVATSFPRGPPV